MTQQQEKNIFTFTSEGISDFCDVDKYYLAKFCKRHNLNMNKLQDLLLVLTHFKSKKEISRKN